MTFTLIQVGDTVYDKELEASGEVLEIDGAFAKIKKENEILAISNLHNLVRVEPEAKEDKYDYNKWYQQVKEFQLAFNHPVADTPTPLTLERMINRKTWEFEEGIEAIHASSTNVDEFNDAVDKIIEGIEKARKKSLKEDFLTNDLDRVVAQADALVDGTYFLQGDFVELGIEPDKLFDIVQKANISKLFTAEDGSKYAKYRESDGKILKSPEFFEPEPLLKEEIERQIESSKK